MPPDGVDYRAKLGDDGQTMLKWGRRLESHPCLFQPCQMLGDHVIARGAIDELEQACCVSLVLVSRPARVLDADLHRVPALEQDGAYRVEEWFGVARSIRLV